MCFQQAAKMDASFLCPTRPWCITPSVARKLTHGRRFCWLRRNGRWVSLSSSRHFFFFNMSFIEIKSGRRSQGIEATDAPFESLNHCTGSFEALLNPEMQCMQNSFSKALPVAKTDTSGMHRAESRGTPLISLSVHQHFCHSQSRFTCSLDGGLSQRIWGEPSLCSLQTASCVWVSGMLRSHFCVQCPVQSWCGFPGHWKTRAIPASLSSQETSRTGSRWTSSVLTRDWQTFLKPSSPAPGPPTQHHQTA